MTIKNWRPEDWKNPHREELGSMVQNKRDHTYRGKHNKRLSNVFEAGADAMLEALTKFSVIGTHKTIGGGDTIEIRIDPEFTGVFQGGELIFIPYNNRP